MTTVPFMSTEARALRMASTARPSAPILSPRPCSGAAARAPASVTLSSSRARFRSISWSNQPPPPVDIAPGSVSESSASAAPPDWQPACLDPEVVLAGQPAIAADVLVDAGSLEHGRHPHGDPVQ